MNDKNQMLNLMLPKLMNQGEMYDKLNTELQEYLAKKDPTLAE